MNHQHLPRVLNLLTGKYLLASLLFSCAIGAHELAAQTTNETINGMNVALDWHTVAEPSYGVSYRYTWEKVHINSRDGAEIAAPLGMKIGKDEGGGLFTLESAPIVVTEAGVSITFDRHIVMHPSKAERGTVLSNDPKDRCKNDALGVTRAVFHERIQIVDAETGTLLAPNINDYSFDISRSQVLNDIDRADKVMIDLARFAGHRVQLRIWISAGYNGRGIAGCTTPVITTTGTEETPHQQDLD